MSLQIRRVWVSGAIEILSWQSDGNNLLTWHLGNLWVCGHCGHAAAISGVFSGVFSGVYLVYLVYLLYLVYLVYLVYLFEIGWASLCGQAASLCHLDRLATFKEQETEDVTIQAAWGVTFRQTVKQLDVPFLCVSLCPISVCLPILAYSRIAKSAKWPEEVSQPPGRFWKS